MSDRRMFSCMDDRSRMFYAKIFNTAMLNLHAVRKGYFDVLICESTDPNILTRWRRAVPQIVTLIKLDNAGEP